jgi:hypothetical protein
MSYYDSDTMTYHSGSDTCERTRRERDDLKQQVETAESERYERERQEERNREDARRQREQDRRDNEAYEQENPGSWEQAFRIGLQRIHKERIEEERDNAHIDKAIAEDPALAEDTCYKKMDFFQRWETQVEKVKTIYSEVMPEVEVEIEALRANALNRIATRAEAETVDPTNGEMAKALRDNNQSYLTYW